LSRAVPLGLSMLDIGEESASTGWVTPSFVAEAAACCGAIATGVPAFWVRAGFEDCSVDFGSSIGPRRCSRKALHVKGNTTSPDAVTPIGIQPPRGIWSLSGVACAGGSDPIDPRVCAKASPDAASVNSDKRLIGIPVPKKTSNLERNNMDTPDGRVRDGSPACCSQCGGRAPGPPGLFISYPRHPRLKMTVPFESFFLSHPTFLPPERLAKTKIRAAL
jgi:hypothetical protein